MYLIALALTTLHALIDLDFKEKNELSEFVTETGFGRRGVRNKPIADVNPVMRLRVVVPIQKEQENLNVAKAKPRLKS